MWGLWWEQAGLSGGSREVILMGLKGTDPGLSHGEELRPPDLEDQRPQ